MQEKLIEGQHEDGLTHYSNKSGHRARGIFWKQLEYSYYNNPQQTHREQVVINTRKMFRDPRSGRK